MYSGHEYDYLVNAFSAWHAEIDKGESPHKFFDPVIKPVLSNYFQVFSHRMRGVFVF